MRSEENIKQLLHLLKIAYLERDEARGQLQSLLNHPTLQNSHQPVNLPPDITKEHIGFKQYDNCYSYPPSPLDCLSDANLQAQDLSAADMAESKQGFDYVGSMPAGVVSSEAGVIDRASVVIENLVKRKPLPQKGRLLKTVIEAGPLLHTLLLAGSLPKWQNPPPLQNLQIPPIPIPIKEGVARLVDQKPPLASFNCKSFEISQGCFQISPSSTSSSGHGSGSFPSRGCLSSDGTDGTDSDLMQDHIPTQKNGKSVGYFNRYV